MATFGLEMCFILVMRYDRALGDLTDLNGTAINNFVDSKLYSYSTGIHHHALCSPLQTTSPPPRQNVPTNCRNAYVATNSICEFSTNINS